MGFIYGIKYKLLGNLPKTILPTSCLADSLRAEDFRSTCVALHRDGHAVGQRFAESLPRRLSEQSPSFGLGSGDDTATATLSLFAALEINMNVSIPSKNYL